MSSGNPSSGYDIRARHPDRNIFYRTYQARSRALWQTERGMADIAYGPGLRERLDFFAAHGTSAATPLLVFIHGGFWHSHDKAEFSFVAAPFIAAGIPVALLNYSLAPEASISDIVVQVGRAIEWLSTNAADLGFSPYRIVVAGHSAGGHLAASALLSPVSPCADRIAGVIAISGIFDLRPLVSDPVNSNIGITGSMAEAHSPLLQIRRCDASIMTVVGADETPAFLDQTDVFSETWRAINGGASATVVPGYNHYSIVLDLAEPASVLSAAAVDFVHEKGR
jgi:arylformamidase